MYRLYFLGLLLVHSLTLSKATTYLAQTCDNSGNFTSNSTFQSNLNLLLTSLSTSNSNFSTNSIGSIPDRVFGLALCRGDVNSSDCSNCLQTAAVDIQQTCPYNKGAIIWFDSCLLRFSNLVFLSSVDESGSVILYNVQNVNNPDVFDKSVKQLIDKISYQAAYKSSSLFATGIYKHSTPVIYGLVQCTRDITGAECYGCLQDIYKYYADNFIGKQGGRLLGKNCNFRFEVYSFYYGKPTVSL